jgi:hypothetical protein
MNSTPGSPLAVRTAATGKRNTRKPVETERFRIKRRAGSSLDPEYSIGLSKHFIVVVNACYLVVAGMNGMIDRASRWVAQPQS